MKDIVDRLMEYHRLDEMAMEQSKAIDRCISLGRRFIEHFHKVYEEGVSGKDFNHHCNEMQSWYDDVRSIRLKSNNKLISKVHLIDWFFTSGSGVDDHLHNEDEIDLYEEFILKLLTTGLNIKNILVNLM